MTETRSLPKLSLSYLHRAPKVEVKNPPLLILLHGFGSNEQDLFSLAEDFPPEFLVLSARAPHVLTEGSYAWFAVDFSSGAPINNKEQAEKSRVLLKQFIEEVASAFAVDTKKIILVGFSQGAIMSYSVALTHPSLTKGVAALSGRVLTEVRSQIESTPALKQLKIFIGHGTEDNVLRIDFAREAKAYLTSLALTPTYYEYNIAHGISREEKLDLLEWISHV